ncbi:glycoside hydrolase family 43 protein [Saccharibacillus sacchari]|uniref:Glycoside hydrolase family 43 protein n=1 Tax=Saccharibacillus sacchari TaxID=456493 RepID=A0ACC6PE83_9BACL
MSRIVNPILPGFHPDPSFLRVGDDYYIATSTFEWMPGVQIHHSRDLVHWRLATRVLTEECGIDFRGSPPSGSIWAPALSYSQGTFYLLFTNVRSRGRNHKDLHNYVTTSASIEGPWSLPARLNGSGFDPFLFHDEDGRKWLLNMRWDFRRSHSNFAGIVMQEFDPVGNRLVGQVLDLYSGTPTGVTEGPQLFKKDGWYYLMTAEGGTGIRHQITLARSRTLQGPYATDPNYPLMCTAASPEYPLQQAGHGSLVQTRHGEWWLAHLCTRPLPGGTRLSSPLGRETALQRCVWTEDGWLRLAHGGRLPALEIEAPDLAAYPFSEEKNRDDFDQKEWRTVYQSLRAPIGSDWASLEERPGWLKLRGRESLVSMYDQSLIARPIAHFRCRIETKLEFCPESFFEMAGLVCYYDDADYYYLRVTYDEIRGITLGVVCSRAGVYDEFGDMEIAAGDWECFYLRAVIDGCALTFFASPDGSHWIAVSPELDFGTLSDEYGGKLGFTGSFVGLCAQDLDRQSREAWFDYFEYTDFDPEENKRSIKEDRTRCRKNDKNDKND